MKIAIVGDTHFGMRGDSIQFHQLYQEFYEKVFFPYLKEHNITQVFQLGDLFDRRKYINFTTLHLSKKYFFDHIEKNNLDFHTILGNHDISYKNTLEVNSSALLLEGYTKIKVHTEPTTVEVDGIPIDLIPWICKENEAEIAEYFNNTKSQICFGHFEIQGFEMDRGNVCHEGIDRDVLSNYEIVLSGHFHHKSSDGHITYVGTPGEMTWADYNDPRGFHIFDTETRELEFIENPYRMFYKILYDETKEDLESVKTKDYTQYTNRIVKVVVVNKTNHLLYDMFLDNLYQALPLDVTVVEDFTDYSEISDEDVIDQADDTSTILDKYIESLELDVDKNILKQLMKEIYYEAQSLETSSA
jgi:predicted phosphodiesterase